MEKVHVVAENFMEASDDEESAPSPWSHVLRHPLDLVLHIGGHGLPVQRAVIVEDRNAFTCTRRSR